MRVMRNRYWFIGLVSFVVIVAAFIVIFPINSIHVPSSIPPQPIVSTKNPDSVVFGGRVLPNGFWLNQMGSQYSSGGIDYAVYTKGNMNFTASGTESGVVFAKKNDPVWHKFLVIEDSPGTANNPYWLDYRNGHFLLLIVDALGAGSGEGNAKLLVIDPIAKTWKTATCFYYADDPEGGSWWKANNHGSLQTAITTYLKMHPKNTYHLNVQTGQYELSQVDYRLHTTETIVEESCSDFQIIFTQ